MGYSKELNCIDYVEGLPKNFIMDPYNKPIDIYMDILQILDFFGTRSLDEAMNKLYERMVESSEDSVCNLRFLLVDIHAGRLPFQSYSICMNYYLYYKPSSKADYLWKWKNYWRNLGMHDEYEGEYFLEKEVYLQAFKEIDRNFCNDSGKSNARV
jgi:hypothetical protein